jgi:hypothetical protein
VADRLVAQVAERREHREREERAPSGERGERERGQQIPGVHDPREHHVPHERERDPGEQTFCCRARFRARQPNSPSRRSYPPSRRRWEGARGRGTRSHRSRRSPPSDDRDPHHRDPREQRHDHVVHRLVPTALVPEEPPRAVIHRRVERERAPVERERLTDVRREVRAEERRERNDRHDDRDEGARAVMARVHEEDGQQHERGQLRARREPEENARPQRLFVERSAHRERDEREHQRFGVQPGRDLPVHERAPRVEQEVPRSIARDGDQDRDRDQLREHEQQPQREDRIGRRARHREHALRERRVDAVVVGRVELRDVAIELARPMGVRIDPIEDQRAVERVAVDVVRQRHRRARRGEAQDQRAAEDHARVDRDRAAHDVERDRRGRHEREPRRHVLARREPRREYGGRGGHDRDEPEPPHHERIAMRVERTRARFARL